MNIYEYQGVQFIKECPVCAQPAFVEGGQIKYHMIKIYTSGKFFDGYQKCPASGRIVTNGK